MTAPLHVYVTSAGFEDALAAETGARGPTAGEPRWPAVVSIRRSLAAPLDPTFARQQLPDARLVRGESPRAIAEGVVGAVTPLGEEGPIALHVFVPDREPYRSIAGRVGPLRQEVLATLGQRDGAALRRVADATLATFNRWAEAHVVQVAVVGKTSVVVSSSRPRPLPQGGFDVQPWPGGVAPVEEDRAAPSRAYGKFEEGLAWLGAAPAAGERCVDLGGSPGGWAWKALLRGARVTAVDRAPLSPPAAGHPALEMVVGNAFTYRPPAPVDWLLCDVICDPARTIELVDRWMREQLCRHVVATIKFKGAAYGPIEEARRRLGAHGWRTFRIKHLWRHHNEVAILASR